MTGSAFGSARATSSRARSSTSPRARPPAHVRIDIGGGRLVTASITNAAGDELAWRAGDGAYAVIKASDVLVGKD